MAWIFPVAKGAGYTLRRPDDSYTRAGYKKTKTNPNGLHWAIDISAPEGAYVVTPGHFTITYKGDYGDLGRVIEGYVPGTGYLRYCHLRGVTSWPIGKELPAGYRIGTVGMTGNTSGPHLHLELGEKKLSSGRDPRKNPARAVREAFDARRFVA